MTPAQIYLQLKKCEGQEIRYYRRNSKPFRYELEGSNLRIYSPSIDPFRIVANGYEKLFLLINAGQDYTTPVVVGDYLFNELGQGTEFGSSYLWGIMNHPEFRIAYANDDLHKMKQAAKLSAE